MNRKETFERVMCETGLENRGFDSPPVQHNRIAHICNVLVSVCSWLALRPLDLRRRTDRGAMEYLAGQLEIAAAEIRRAIEDNQ